MATETSIEEVLKFRRQPAGSALLIVSVEDCPPCRLVQEAIGEAVLPSDLPVLKATASPTDKKAFGAVLKAGIDRFPHLEVYAEGRRVASADGAQGEEPREVARWIEELVASAQQPEGN